MAKKTTQKKAKKAAPKRSARLPTRQAQKTRVKAATRTKKKVVKKPAKKTVRQRRIKKVPIFPDEKKIDNLLRKAKARGFVTETEILFAFPEMEEYVLEFERFLLNLEKMPFSGLINDIRIYNRVVAP